MVLITEKDISTTYNHFNMKQVETQLQDQEYELLKAFKEKNGLKTDYQGLKELVKALDIPEFHEEIKPEEKKEVKKEVRHIDRTNLENWVKDLEFEQKEVWNFYKAKSYDEGVKHIKAEHAKMNFKSASDMTKEELERMTFTIIKGHATYSIDETNSLIEI